MMGEVQMIDKIQGVRAQGSPTISGNKRASAHRMETNVLLPANEDSFIPNGSRAEYPNEELNRKNLSPEMASASHPPRALCGFSESRLRCSASLEMRSS